MGKGESEGPLPKRGEMTGACSRLCPLDGLSKALIVKRLGEIVEGIELQGTEGRQVVGRQLNVPADGPHSKLSCWEAAV